MNIFLVKGKLQKINKTIFGIDKSGEIRYIPIESWKSATSVLSAYTDMITADYLFITNEVLKPDKDKGMSFRIVKEIDLSKCSEVISLKFIKDTTNNTEVNYKSDEELNPNFNVGKFRFLVYTINQILGIDNQYTFPLNYPINKEPIFNKYIYIIDLFNNSNREVLIDLEHIINTRFVTKNDNDKKETHNIEKYSSYEEAEAEWKGDRYGK